MEETPDKQKWKVLKSKYLFRKSWLTVRSDEVLLPTGKTIPEYYVLEYPNWVNIIAITNEGKFVFVRQYRHGLGLSSYELCAGVIDPEDESYLDAAKRELLEETGYGNGTWNEFMVMSANPGTHTNLTYCYLATDVEKTSSQHLDETEDITVHLFTIDEIKQLLINDEIKQAMHSAPLWRYFAEKNLM